MKDLTGRQKEILGFISSYMTENGRSPTLREIGERFGFSHSAARDAVLALVRKGCLEKGENELRSLSFPLSERMERENIPVPFYSSEPSLEDIEKGAAAGRIFIPRSMDGKGAFAFRITSESMRNAGILPGDIAIMTRCTSGPVRDDVVLSSYADEEEPMELRRFQPIGTEYAELWPENDTMGIIKVMRSNLITAGILACIRRDYRR